MTDTEYDTKSLLARAIESLPDKVELVYIDRNDQFSDKNLAAIVGGDKDNVLEGWDFSDTESNGVDYLLEQSGLDEEEREALRESDEWEEFQEACYERDESTPYADILRNTGRAMVRFYVRNGKGERITLPYDAWRLSPEESERYARKFCSACGLSWEKNADNFRELVDNATGGGVLCLIGYVEMRDVDKWVEHCARNPERARVSLRFDDPHVLIHDHINGSGHDVQVKGRVTIKFGAGALDTTHGVMVLDAKNVAGWSWGESCAYYQPAYKIDPEAYLYLSRKGAKPDKPSPEMWPGT